MTEQRDPRTLYFHEKFKSQQQDTPALQRQMEPEPDCGEDSYQGSGKLAGRKALITGGDSGIGRAAAIAYAREGADVAIQFFPPEEEDALDVVEAVKDSSGKFMLFPCDLREDGAATALIEPSSMNWALDILVLNAGQQIAQQSISELPMSKSKQHLQLTSSRCSKPLRQRLTTYNRGVQSLQHPPFKQPIQVPNYLIMRRPKRPSQTSQSILHNNLQQRVFG